MQGGISLKNSLAQGRAIVYNAIVSATQINKSKTMVPPINIHLRLDDRPFNPHPQWMTDLGIPEDTNWGICNIEFPVAIQRKMLLEANQHNRPMTDSRIRPLRLALQHQTYREDHVDPVVVDWNHQMCNGQKRMCAGCEANLPVRCRFEYGVDPALRVYIDSAEWRKYHHRYEWVERDQDNQIINQMMALHFKLYSGLGTGSYAYDDALSVWTRYQPHFKWLVSVVRRNDLPVEKSGISANTVSTYLALAELHRRDRQTATAFANELYGIEDEGSTPCLQAKAFRRWLTSKRDKIVDQKEMYGRSVYFMRRALHGEAVKCPKDPRIKSGEGSPTPKAESWNDEMEEHRQVVREEGKLPVKQDLANAGIKSVDAVIGAVTVLNRHGMGAQQVKELVLADTHRWNSAAYYGRKFYDAVAKGVTKAGKDSRFSTTAAVAFVFHHSKDDVQAAEFLKRVTAKPYMKEVHGALDIIREVYGFKTKLAQSLAFERLCEIEAGYGKPVKE